MVIVTQAYRVNKTDIDFQFNTYYNEIIYQRKLRSHRFVI